MPDYDFDYPEEGIDFSQIPEIPDPTFDDPVAQGPGYIDWENWGGGAGGDGTNGSGDSGGGGLAAALGRLLTGAGGAAGGLSGILSAITGGKGGLQDLLSILGIAGGSINQGNAVKDAAERMEAAAGKANDLASSTIGSAQGNYTPYINAGAGALEKMQNFDTSPLAAKFQSKAPSGKLTLADLARR